MMDLETITNSIMGNSSFSITDYVVVGFSLAVVLFCGFYHGLFSPSSREDFLVGGRVMTSSPIAVSIAMLYISALAVIENPAQIYYHGIQPFLISIVTVVIVPLSVFLFVSMLHNMQLTSIHQYIGHRFESTTFRCITSLAFIAHQTYYVCAMLAEVSNLLERYFDIPVMTSIIGIGAFTIVSTTLGGFKATVWTHVFHFIWITLFLFVLTIVSGIKAGGFMHAFELAAENGRLEWDLQVNPFQQHNLFNFLVGYGFITLMEISTNQHLVQRYSSIDTLRDANKSIFLGIPLHILPSLLCLLTGIFLQAAYAGCDPITLGHIESPQDIIPHFISKNLSFIPGMIGFFAATVVGCAISIYSTSVSSVTACACQDFIFKLMCCNSAESKKQEVTSSVCCRLISFAYGVVCCVLTLLFTMKFSDFENILTLPVANSYNFLQYYSILYGPLAAVFLMGMFCPCINKYGACVGFLGGVACTAYIAVNKVLTPDTTPITTLPPIMGDCPIQSLGLNETVLRFLPWHPKDDEALAEALNIDGPMKDLLSISYLLLTLLGAVLTIIISFPVSIFTGGFCLCASRKVPAFLLHPALSFCDCCVDSQERHMRHAISHRYVDRIASVHNLFSGNANTPRLGSKPPSYKYRSLSSSPAPTE